MPGTRAVLAFLGLLGLSSLPLPASSEELSIQVGEEDGSRAVVGLAALEPSVVLLAADGQTPKALYSASATTLDASANIVAGSNNIVVLQVTDSDLNADSSGIETTDSPNAIPPGTYTPGLRVSSTSNPTGLLLTGIETGTDTGVFQQRVALLKAADHDQLEQVLASTAGGAPLNPATDSIAALIAKLASANKVALADWVANTYPTLRTSTVTGGTSTSLVPMLASDTVQTLLNRILIVEHGDAITATYADAQPAATRTATADVDAAAPTFSGIVPLHGLSIKMTQPLLRITVTDSEAGMNPVDIHLLLDVSSGGVLTEQGLVAKTPIAPNNAGFLVEHITVPLVQGSHRWRIIVQDRVGNIATTDVVMPCVNGVQSVIPLSFTVDLTVPVMMAAKTGVGIMNDVSDLDAQVEAANAALCPPATVAPANDFVEFSSNEWIKVQFTEAIDAASIQTSDFQVTNNGQPVTVLEVLRRAEVSVPAALKAAYTAVDQVATGNAVTCGNITAGAKNCQSTSAGKFIYLKVDPLPPDALPVVTLVGPVLDAAGNAALTYNNGANQSAQLTALDGIGPGLTVNVDKPLGKAGTVIGITVTTNEPLIDIPAVTVRTSPSNSVAVSVVPDIGGTSWSGVYIVGSNDLGQFQVVAAGADGDGNPVVSSPASFEADGVGTFITFGLGNDQTIETGRDVLLTFFVEDDEADGIPVESPQYTIGADSHSTATVTAATIEKLDGPSGNVLHTEIVHSHNIHTLDQANYFFYLPGYPYSGFYVAIGYYRLTVQASDEMGNQRTQANEFQVTPPSQTISGIVVQADGVTPIAGVKVGIADFYQGYCCLPGVQTQGDGTYAFTNVGSGDFLISAQAPGYSKQFYDRAHSLITATKVTLTGTGASNIHFVLQPRPQLAVMFGGNGTGQVSSSPSGIECSQPCSAPFDLENPVILYPSPTVDSLFAGWNGACTGVTVPCVVTMTNNKTVTATFVLKTFAVTVANSGAGSGLVLGPSGTIDCGLTCVSDFTIGATVTLKALPSATSLFAGWSGACSGKGDCTVVVNGPISVTAAFGPASAVPGTPWPWLAVLAGCLGLAVTWASRRTKRAGN